MNCKNCQTELEEGVTLCPSCGTENAEVKAGLGAGKIALLVVLAVAAIAVVAALILGGGSGSTPAETTLPSEPALSTTPGETKPAPTIPADGNPDDVTCKGTYTVTDEQVIASASDVVATMGEATLTNAELQVYYWMQIVDFLNQCGSYAGLLGLDVTQSLDTQLGLEGTMTWQQYFLNDALNNWLSLQALCLEADAAGYVLEEAYVDYLADLPQNLEESAAGMGFENALAMIQSDMGPGVSMEDYMTYLNEFYKGNLFYGKMVEEMVLTDEEIETYFDAHAAEYLENGLEKNDERYVDVRHILVMPKSASGESTFTEEEWAAAETEANRILNEWLTKNPDEDGFSVLAQVYSEDPGSAENGGLYQNVYVGQMVEPFENWCFEESRQYGDYGIVKTTYGYHIMYFVRSNPVWYLTAQQALLGERSNAFLLETMDKHPAQIDYSAIALADVDLGLSAG